MASAPLDKKYLKEEEHEMTDYGNKRYTICGMRFETTPNYAVRKAVGQGAYGHARTHARKLCQPLRP